MVHAVLKPGLENLSITLLACEMSATVWYFEHSLALPFLGVGVKTDISSPVATAEFSIFAGIVSAALNMPANLENSAVATGLEMSVFIPIPKNNAKECSN